MEDPHQLAARLGLPPAMQALVALARSPAAAVAAVLEAGGTGDALRLLAGLLPRRYALAWLCEQAAKESLDEHDQIGLRIAQEWVWEPSEMRREAACQHVQTDRLRSLSGWMAAAAAASLPERGELTPPAGQAMLFGAIALAMAVTLLAARQPALMACRREGFARSALALLETS